MMTDYQAATFGREEPDLAFCNGRTLLSLRAKCGIDDVNDSNGMPIRAGQVYILTPGKALPYDLPFGDE